MLSSTIQGTRRCATSSISSSSSSFLMTTAHRIRSQLWSSPTTSTALRCSSSLSDTPAPRQSLITSEDGVHQNMKISKSYRNKPLFRRQGDVRFKTGMEAANLLVKECQRRDSHETEFIDSVTTTLQCLSPIFDRNPKYAFVAKTLMEPERFIQFRVAWIDDLGVVRMNRGFRVQYSSSIGPYEGALHLGHHVNTGVIKALGFDAVFSNAVTGYNFGAAAGGSDFNPFDKSEAELQRFCQSYMTELAKYVGPDMDTPWMGMGVGAKEMGYLFGQYKRINIKHGGMMGRPFLSAVNPLFEKAPGFTTVHFAHEMLADKGDSLEGKRCMVVGAGKIARSVAEKLLDYGAIPITFSDASGHVYEETGFTEGKLKTINQIKNERGALLGRYIISSTTAQFNTPDNLLDIPCDLCFPCGAMNDIDNAAVNKLADNGCMAVIEGGQNCVTPGGRKVLKKRGLMYGPSSCTMTGSAIVQVLGEGVTDEDLSQNVKRIYTDVKDTAKEFNARGDLFAGANIAGFLRVANAMMMHGAV